MDDTEAIEIISEYYIGEPEWSKSMSIVDMMQWIDDDLARVAEYLRSLGYIVIEPRAVESTRYIANACPLCNQEIRP